MSFVDSACKISFYQGLERLGWTHDRKLPGCCQASAVRRLRILWRTRIGVAKNP